MNRAIFDNGKVAEDGNSPCSDRERKRHLPSNSSVACVAIYLVVTAILVFRIQAATGGHFIYALDDAYIHLQLASNIAHGNYGINAHEISTPSSSIIWPFLLIFGTDSSWHALVPFIWNLLFGSIAAFLLGLIIDRWDWAGEGHLGTAKRLLTSLLFVFVANLVGLTFVGMEHTLQVLLALGSAYGIIQVLEERALPTWCIACAALGPAVRYENAAITVAIVIVLIIQKRIRTAVILIVLSALTPMIFSAAMIHEGLHALPNSVLAKAQLSPTHTGVSLHLIGNLGFQIKSELLNVSFNLLLLLVALVAVKSTRWRAQFLWAAFSALFLHALVGRFGWFHRYEVYAVAFGATILFVAFQQFRVSWYLVAFELLLISAPYIQAVLQAPSASLDIYNQQFQISRFLKDYYRQSAAVNDLGLASYRHTPGTYVLDLAGLGSQEALEAGRFNPDALESMTHRHQIGLAILYPDKFAIPESWHPVAILHSPLPIVSVNSETVVFYATQDGDESQIRSELLSFQTTVPRPAVLTLQ